MYGDTKAKEKTIARFETETCILNKFLNLINSYENFDTLRPTMINEFIEKIIVHERDIKGSQSSNQKIEIYFNFIGNYEPPKEEMAVEERLRLEEEEKNHREKGKAPVERYKPSFISLLL